MEVPKTPDNPTVEPSREERMQAMDDLSKRFGGSAKIPEEDLLAIGYVRRTMDDGTLRLTPKELIKDNEKSLKERERPFELIPVELTAAEQSFRFIPGGQRQMLLDKLVAVEYAFYPNWQDGTSVLGPIEQIDPRLHNLRAFAMDFTNFLKEQGVDDIKLEREAFAGFLLFANLPVRREPVDFIDDPNDFLADHFLKTQAEEADGSVSSLEARNMYDELSRLGGYYGDATALTHDFKTKLAEPHAIEETADTQAERDLATYLNSLDLQTAADMIRFVLPKYLKYVGLEQMAQATQASSDLTTLPESLVNMDTLGSFREEEASLRQSLKTATTDERMVISGRLKEIDVAKRKRAQIRNGVIDYFSSPQVYAEICKRKVKEAQDFLLGGKSKAGEKAKFYLDASPNVELDKDPGVLSGDCTAGKPLPFDRSDIPLYNVKVFGEGQEHVGNMYLLVTKENGGRTKVWHFDAIQVPRLGIDWSVSVPGLISSLASAAELKGDIDEITVNNEPHLISNYDYIQDAVRKYWEQTARDEVEINIPPIGFSEDYSELQGSGEALVLWKKVASDLT